MAKERALTLTLRFISVTLSERMMFYKQVKDLSLLGKIVSIGILTIIIAALVATIRFKDNKADLTPKSVEPTLVSITTLSELQRDNNSTLQLTATLHNKSSEDLRFEIPGQIKHVYTKIGTWVKAGTLIAEVENSAQRAQVTQAYGILEAARAQVKAAESQLNKVNNGATIEDKQILASQVTAAAIALDSAYTVSENALLGTYASVSNTISFSADSMLQNPNTVNPTLAFQTTEYSAKISAQNMRVQMGTILQRQSTQTEHLLTRVEIDTELVKTLQELREVKRFTDALLTALDGAIVTSTTPQATIDSYVNTINTARSGILGNISAITSAVTGIDSAQQALNIAKDNESKLNKGARNEDVRATEASLLAAEASVTTALGGYNAAYSQLEKTRIRASISGTLSSLSAKTGDFVNTQSIGRIVGNGGSEVVFYISTSDSDRVLKGSKVTALSGKITGEVVSISTDTDAITQQLEVRADLSDKLDLPNNSKLNISILSDTTDITPSNIKTFAPINSIRFGADESYIYTINPVGSTLTVSAIPVTIGDVINDTVELLNFDAPLDTTIITDVRGLKDGQRVITN